MAILLNLVMYDLTSVYFMLGTICGSARSHYAICGSILRAGIHGSRRNLGIERRDACILHVIQYSLSRHIWTDW